MVQLSKVVAEYRAGIQNDHTGELIAFSAVVLEDPNGRFSIEYSHALRPSDESGVYYSDSYTNAPDLPTAVQNIEGWARLLKSAVEVVKWRDV